MTDDAWLNEIWDELFSWREETTKRSEESGVEPIRATENREVRQAGAVEPDLGRLAQLPGVWRNLRDPDNPDDPGSPFRGRGWNVIALPFASTDAIAPFQAGNTPPFRLLMNRYNEQLVFSTVDDKVPNRGITQDRQARADQLVATLDYEQTIIQTDADDTPFSGDAGAGKLAIHHEPGLFLLMKQQIIDGFDIARLGTIPHGNAVNAIGRSAEVNGPPTISDLSALPEGVTTDIVTAVAAATDPNSASPLDRYLFPYQHYIANPFLGLFSPDNANALLQGALQPGGLPGNVVTTTILDFSTEDAEAGIVNIPFIERQADASQMRSTFWLMELDRAAPGEQDGPHLVLAYSQFINLDFFPRFDGKPGLIRWPHVSINMMEKVAGPPPNPAIEPQPY